MNIQLLSTSTSDTTYDFNQSEISIGSSRLNDVQVKFSKMDRHHCKLTFSKGEWFLENLSKKNILLRSEIQIERKQKVQLQHQDVFFLNDSKEGFEFMVKNEEKEFKSQIEKIVTCSICMQIFFQPTSIAECLHTFCGGCLSKMVQKRCPMCRRVFQHAGPNHAIQQICELLQSSNQSLKRDNKETAALDQKNAYKTWKLTNMVFTKQDLPLWIMTDVQRTRLYPFIPRNPQRQLSSSVIDLTLDEEI